MYACMVGRLRRVAGRPQPGPDVVTSARSVVPAVTRPRLFSRAASRPTSRSGPTPGGTAHTDEPVWRTYSFMASLRASAAWIGTNWRRGSRW